MRLYKIILLAGIVLLLVVRCSGPKVIAFTGSNPDFASYYTFRVKHPATPEKEEPESNEFINKVEHAINNQMVGRGYENAEVADIVVSYNLILDNEVDYRMNRTSPYSYPYSYGNYPYSYPYWFEKDEYTKGTLLVELRETLTRKLIWQASLDLKYNRRSSSKKKKDPVENAFDIIFSQYPYVAGKSKPQIEG